MTPGDPGEPFPTVSQAPRSGADSASPVPAHPADGAASADLPEASARERAPLWTPLQLTATGEEYFRIWVVNVLLTVLTLGIYSAWAKVRRLQYLYRNTRLDGAAFHYHGNPVAILRGRALAVVLFVLYQYAFDFSAVLGVAVMMLLVLTLPWLFTRSLRFRLANTSHRGITFQFNGGAGEGYAVFAPPVVIYVVPAIAVGVAGATAVGVAVAGVVSLAGLLLLPWFHARLRRFQANGASWGASRARAIIPTGKFYGVWLASVVVAMVSGLLVAIAMSVVAALLASLLWQTGMEVPENERMLWILAGVLWAWLSMAAPAAYVAAKVQNLVWPATKINNAGFQSHASASAMIKIAVTNALLTAITLGLYRPFAVIRMARYRLNALWVDGTAFEGVIAAASAGDNDATGEGAADMFDVDLAL